MSEPTNTKSMFRASIIYTGKYADRTGCAFVKAQDREEAQKFIEGVIKTSLKKHGFPQDCFTIKITLSSQEEVEFFMENRKTKNYDGIAN